MTSGISDIQINKQGNIEITFCHYPDCEDYMILTIDKRTAWDIAKFCKEKLSYGAELKKD